MHEGIQLIQNYNYELKEGEAKYLQHFLNYTCKQKSLPGCNDQSRIKIIIVKSVYSKPIISVIIMSYQIIVRPTSDQWIYVTFRLQLMLGSPQIQLVSLRKHKLLFPEQYQSHLKIQAGVELTDMDLSTATSIKDSLRKDLILKAGRVNVNLENAKYKIYRILLLKVAVSQVLPCINEHGLSAQDFLKNQKQFDAVYMSPRQQELAVYSHEYMVRDPKQYQWQYDAEFMINDRKDWDPQRVICANCKISQAKYYCIHDQESYCLPCFGDLHRSDRKSKHKHQPLSPYNCPPFCPKVNHDNEPLTYYCFTCKQLKCRHCLNDSDHNKQSYSGIQRRQLEVYQQRQENKQLHRTMESREFGLKFRNTLESMLQQAKQRITTNIRQIQNKIQLISGHYDLRVKQFERVFEQRVSSIREWATAELNMAVGMHSELKRKYDEVLWLQTLSLQIQERCELQTNMQSKQGLGIYLNKCFSVDYFLKIEKKVQDLKIFN